MNINLTNVQSIPIVVNANITAENNKVYHVVANATFTDPTPVEGRGYVVFVRNGTATIGGNPFSTSGNFIYRLFHSGAWALYPFGNINSLSTLFNAAYVPQSRTINGLDLSANRTLTTANINDSTNKRYVTDAQLTVLGNTSGTNTGDQNLSGLVPYTGATADVDLDTFGLDAKFIKIKGTAGNGHLNLKHQSSDATAGGSESVIYADASGNPKWKNDGNAVQNVMLENSAITGATKTKITYDAKGLVTSGTDATTADIADSTNKRYVTDAQLTILGNTSNTNTGDETQSSILSKLGWWNILNQTAGTVSSGTSNTITKSIALPSVPNVLNFRANFLKTGATNTYTVRAYLSEVDNNIGGTAILIATVTGANTAVSNLPLKRTFDIIAGNILGFNSVGSTPTDDVNLSNAKLNLAIPTGTPLYLIFAVQCANASDSARFESAQINNFSF